MKLSRWLSVILMMGLILALNSLSAQAGPNITTRMEMPMGGMAKSIMALIVTRSISGATVMVHTIPVMYAHHGGPPHVAYVTPVTPMIGIPYSQPQPNYSQPATPGLSGNLNWNF